MLDNVAKSRAPSRPRRSMPSEKVELWDRPGFLVRRLHQITVAIFLDEMAELGVTPVQFGALTIIADRPGIEQSALGEELGIDRVNAGDVVQRLIKNNLARREVFAQDRRYKNIFLTEAGQSLLREGLKRMPKVQQRLLQPLDAEQSRIFLQLLTQLIDGNNDQGRTTLRRP